MKDINDQKTSQQVSMKAQNDEVGAMHPDILSKDTTAIIDASPTALEVKKLVGNRFDVSEIMKSYGSSTNTARIKESAQERLILKRVKMINNCNSKNDVFHKRLKSFINKEIHIKLDGDDTAVAYTLREMEKDFIVVDYGESQRFIAIDKIIFLQIGNYPKE